jgi:hypothetical protein
MAEKRFIIEVRTKGFARATKDFKEINQSGKQYVQTTQRMRRSTQGLERGLGSLRNRLLVNAFAIGVLTKAAQVFFRSSIEFEDVKTRLIGLTGSVEDAEFAFARLNKIATTTPFELGDVVNAGAQLEAFGASALDTIKPITDLAAFMGTTATEAANAFGRAYSAGAGAADILREKGVLNIIKDFKGIEDITKLTLPQFRQAMIDAFTDPTTGIAGSSERLSTTFRGAFSNMVDATARLTAELTEGLLPTLKNAMIGTTEFLNKGTEFIRFTKEGRQNFETFGESVDSFTLKVKNTKDIEELQFELNRLNSEIKQANQPIENLTTTIVGLAPVTKKTSDNLKIFTDLNEKGAINLDAMNSGVIFQKAVFDEAAQAIENENTALITMGTGTLRAEEKLKILLERIKELEEAEALRNKTIREQTESEIIRRVAIEGRMEQAEKEKQLATQFIELFNQTEEGQRRNIERQIELIETNREFLSQFGNVDAVIANLSANLITTADASNGAQRNISALGGVFRELSRDMTDSTQIMNAFFNIASLAASLAGDSASGGVFGAIRSLFTAHTGGLITNGGIQRFANGGVVRGQDNVPILAQAGEFVMRREAVENIGVRNLMNMNQTGRANSVNINVAGNMIANDEFVRDTLIPEINKTLGQDLA